MVPLEYRTRSGDLVGEVGGRRYRLYEWVDLDPRLEPPVTPLPE
ncbi:MAG TPA: hypothetical protein VGS21_10880 [Acidimicrobiales bacterium]|nr:hypothetical protein [Acidimicrobiales bacterium]